MNITRIFRNTIGTAMLAGVLMLAPTAKASVFVSVGFAPPPIPVYTQPLSPGDGYIWTPGYWAYGPDGYYWIDGAWVLAPYQGALWTPGYWGWGGASYFWFPGYWGRTVGFYGGINYGFGYFGTGFYGGYWHGNHFFYNSVYSHVGVGFHNVYSQPYAGGTFHGGSSSFIRTGNTFAGNHGDFRGSTVNGMGHVNPGNFGNRAGEVNSNARPSSFNNRSMSSAPQVHNFTQSNPGQARSFSAPSSPHSFQGNGGFQGGGNSFGGGGGFHGGGGGDFHGGGGGGGSHGGGGGHR